EKVKAIKEKLKAEEDVKSAEAKIDALAKEKDEEIERLKRREAELVLEERVRADLAEVSVLELEKQS
ncbi:hypothetical protein PIB30_078174, partial [Stylosanthes scabra]|nr:hypothetical protein [Stylosanthes scabra]